MPQELDKSQETILTPEEDIQSQPSLTADKAEDSAPENGGVGSDGVHKAKVESPHRRRWYRILGIIGTIFTIVAWVTFFFSDTVAIITAGIGFVASFIGCFSGRGCLRDLSITATVASFVLVLVYAVFYIGMDYVMGMI